jgi:ATP-dependent Zn protease
MDEMSTTTAYHEAGHAVAYWALCRPFRDVTIIPDADCKGCVRGELTPDFGDDSFKGNWGALVRDEAVISLAGPVAERMHRGEILYEVEDIAAQLTPDDQVAIKMACEDCAAVITQRDGKSIIDISLALDEMLAAAIGIMQEHWGAVDAVAQRLLTDKMLTAAEFYETASQAPRVAPPTLRSGCVGEGG